MLGTSARVTRRPLAWLASLPRAPHRGTRLGGPYGWRELDEVILPALDERLLRQGWGYEDDRDLNAIGWARLRAPVGGQREPRQGSAYRRRTRPVRCFERRRAARRQSRARPAEPCSSLRDMCLGADARRSSYARKARLILRARGADLADKLSS
jgi:hypothetical protein